LVTGFNAAATGNESVGTVAVTQSAEAVPVHAATATQMVSTPIIRFIAGIISSN
jgi:hypothetical protein